MFAPDEYTRRCWEPQVKKGRHRRFEEARALKRSSETFTEPCVECGAPADEACASWCLARVLDDEDEDVEPEGVHSEDAETERASW